MYKDISQLLAGAFAGLPPASYDADNTPTAVDLLGYNACAIYIGVGVGGITFDNSNKVEFKLTHSDDDDSYTAVTDADVRCADTGFAVGTGGIVYSLIAAHAAATVTEIGYIGGKRYLKLLADFSGSHGTATPMFGLFLKGRALRNPVA